MNVLRYKINIENDRCLKEKHQYLIKQDQLVDCPRREEINRPISIKMSMVMIDVVPFPILANIGPGHKPLIPQPTPNKIPPNIERKSRSIRVGIRNLDATISIFSYRKITTNLANIIKTAGIYSSAF
jgi:hypothetical protein